MIANPFEVINLRLSNIESLLLDIKHPDSPPKNSEGETLLSPREAREFLKVSAPTLWRLEKKGKVKAYGLGGKRYYKRSELEQALILKK